MAAAVALSAPDTRPDGPVLLTIPPRPPIGRDPSRRSSVDAGEFSAKDVFKALRYHAVLFLTLGTLAAVALGAAGWFLFPTRYTTYAMLRVESSIPSLLDNPQNNTGRSDFANYISTQAGLIKSHKIMNRAIRKPNVLNLPMLQGYDDPAAFLEEKVTLEFSERSELLKVAMSGEDPAQITNIVNGVVDAFITEVDTYKQDKQQKYDKLLRTKNEQERILDDLLKSYAAQFRQPTANEAKVKMRQGRLLRYNQLLLEDARVKAELNRTRELIAAALAHPPEPVQKPESAVAMAADVTFQIETDPLVQQKAADVKRIENYITNYRRTAANPESDHMKDYQRRLAKEKGELEELKNQRTETLKRSLAAQTHVVTPQPFDAPTAVAKLQGTVERLTIDEKNVNDELRGFADLLAEEPVTGPPPEEARVRIQLESAQRMVSQLENQSKIQKAELEADDRVKLIEKANVPQNREMKKQLAFTGIGGLAGFALVGGLITMGELRRRRVYAHTDEVFSQVPLLGRIPEHGFVRPVAGAEPAADDTQGLAFREAIDRIKTLVLRQMLKSRMQTLLVTSPSPDEGKSILAWNLAAGLARTDYRVLFIDANLHAPTIHKHLEIAMPAGLAETLREERTLTEVVLRTAAPNLFCVAAGNVNEEAKRGLDKGALQKVLDRARREFDFVVIDSCALVQAVDPLYIAQRVDAALLSVRTFQSRVPAIEQACRRLKMLGTTVLGAVLTDPTLSGADV
ncbi:MAG: AAA family ATPase [Gemmataceae bacterium]